MTDPAATLELPPLQEAWLAPEQLTALCDDIEHGAELLEITLKSRGSSRATLTSDSLRESLSALLRGEVMGLQIRYRHGGDEWWDTLMKTESGVRLVRVNHTEACLF